MGNLKERSRGSEVLGTIFPQLIVHLYFLFGPSGIGWINMPIETAMSTIYVLISLLQLALGYSTIKRLVAKAMADFHLQPIDDAADDAALTLRTRVAGWPSVRTRR